MTFGAPFAFWFFALAAPIVGFYLMRARVRRRPVTSLLFWDQLMTQARTSPLWRQLRRWLSLLLQLLLLALVVLALGRPMLNWQTETRRPIALTLDPSVSMQAKGPDGISPWEASIQTAKRLVGQMRFFDEMTLIVASSPPRVISPWTRNKRALRQALDDLQPILEESDPHDGIRLALNLANRGDIQGETIVLTDGVWRQPAPDEWANEARWIWMNNSAIQNIGVTRFAARRSLQSASELAVFVEVQSTSPTAPDTAATPQPESDTVASNVAESVALELYQDGQLLDVIPVDTDLLNAGMPWRKEWTFNEPDGGEFEVKLALDQDGAGQDGLDLDNQATCQVEAARLADVYWVSEPNLFLDAAIKALPQVRFQRIWPPESIPALVADRNGNADAGDDSETAADQNPELWIFNQVTPDPNWAWTPENVLLIAPEGSGFWGASNDSEDESGIPTVSEWQENHPALKNLDLASVFFREALNIQPPDGSEIYASSFQGPLMYGDWNDNSSRRWMVWAFQLTATDFVYRTAYPSALANLIQTIRPLDKVSADSSLPGPTETALKQQSQLLAGDWINQTEVEGSGSGISDGEEGEAAGASSNTREVKTPWWSIFPLWWWALAAALAWLIGEWILYTRRVTE